MKKAIIITGPTGSGKTALLQFLQDATMPATVFRKVTTRSCRRTEVDGVDYDFVDRESFAALRSSGTLVHVKIGDFDDNLYGIDRRALNQASDDNSVVVFTAHGPKEAVEVKETLANFMGFTVVSVHVLATERTRRTRLLHLAEADRYEKRLAKDAEMKLEAILSSFSSFDYVLLNEGDIRLAGNALGELVMSLRDARAMSANIPLYRVADLQKAPVLRVILESELDALRHLLGSIYSCPKQTPLSELAPALEEYRILRDEIAKYHGERNSHVNFSVLLTIALIGAVSTGNMSQFASVFILLPIAYCLLAFLYADRSIRVIRIADYIHNDLRIRINDLARGDYFHWEFYKRRTTRFPRFFMQLVDRLRLAMFLAPAVMCVTSYPFLLNFGQWYAWQWAMWCLDIALIVSIVLFFWYIQETSGARTSRPIQRLI